MFSSTDEAPTSQFCLVYEKDTGKVVHIHEFIPAEPSSGCSREELEIQALQLAPTKYPRSGLAAFHPTTHQVFKRHFRYQVDTRRNALLVEKSSDAAASDFRASRRT